MKFKLSFLTVLSFCLMLSAAGAQERVRVTFENLQPSDGFFLTTVFGGFHDGSFDIFDPNSAASSSLELLAEDGLVSGLQSDFTANGVGQQTTFGNAAGFGGAPFLDPGEASSQLLDLDSDSRFFNFATMVIPTNDAFFGNGTAIEILDDNGVFTGNQTFTLGLADIWDAGTEVNDGEGAAFSTAGGISSDEGGVVTLGPDLSNLDGFATAAGTTVNFDSAASSPFLRVTIESVAVPEPTAISLMGVFGMLGLFRRQRS